MKLDEALARVDEMKPNGYTAEEERIFATKDALTPVSNL